MAGLNRLADLACQNSPRTLRCSAPCCLRWCSGGSSGAGRGFSFGSSSSLSENCTMRATLPSMVSPGSSVLVTSFTAPIT